MRVVLLTLCVLVLLSGTAGADQLGNLGEGGSAITCDDWPRHFGMFIATEGGTIDSIVSFIAEQGTSKGRMIVSKYVGGTLSIIDSTAETEMDGLWVWHQWASLENGEFSANDTLFVGIWGTSDNTLLLYYDAGDSDNDSVFTEIQAYEDAWVNPNTAFDFKNYREGSAYIVYTPSGEPPASTLKGRRRIIIGGSQ